MQTPFLLACTPLMSIAIFTLYGLLFGSFLTVVVDRVPRGASIVRPGSACGSCGLRLVARDLVPVFSWLALRGRCRKCHTSIGTEPLVLELSTAALFGVMAHHFGLSWEAVAFCVLMAGLVALSWIDLHTKRLPREITHTIAALGFPLLCVAALVAHEPRRIFTALLGAGIALAVMALTHPHLFQRRFAHVEVETGGHLTQGMTVIDQRDLKEVPEPNCDWLTGLDADAAWDVVVESIAHFSR